LKKLRLEIWKSTENREERHYFLKDGESHGYQNADYLFGVNPRHVTDEQIELILAIIRSGATLTG
jgi:hypothetical protein